MNIKEEALKLHEQNKGKIEMKSTIELSNNRDLSLAYTPGVAEPCRKIADNKEDVYRYTSKGHFVAVVTDGTAVLGLGDIGPEAALPVMEGKAALFKSFGNIDAVPICLDTKGTEEIIQAVTYIAPSFGGINLEDIASPKCFEIEKRLDAALDIPVFHDDQHGTAIVVAAAMLNSLKLAGKDISRVKVVVNGPGSAGTAIVKMLMTMGVQTLVVCDEHGILSETRKEALKDHKIELARITNPENKNGDLSSAIVQADVFIGVSIGNILKPEMIKMMKKDPIVFAMANPEPEIDYNVAKQSGVKIMGTGRSDFPNQINNVLAFPGIFKGALSARATTINDEMKLAAAEAIAALVTEEELTEEYIIPGVFDERVAQQVADYVKAAAVKTKVNRV
ncbi:NAD-dependent malic enzyme [Desemzia sp. RIT804]|uniref:NAD(P)-dependent malic enzyme n=1 Tax=Desemzia sp. RIT 804 TaxID=2810209 RepID=UPI001951BE38|nr:malic enzyme-like NAD(P)-binding protein [Desemzia sp. RIT 804]MBM6613541.1 NAD-dependent malic enzyme [Desemzia sp. RIT 804]